MNFPIPQGETVLDVLMISVIFFYSLVIGLGHRERHPRWLFPLWLVIFIVNVVRTFIYSHPLPVRIFAILMLFSVMIIVPAVRRARIRQRSFIVRGGRPSETADQ